MVEARARRRKAGEQGWSRVVVWPDLDGAIDGHLALTRWASPDTARKSTVQARPGPVSIVSVSGTARL
jgi:hypothetical protein